MNFFQRSVFQVLASHDLQKVHHSAGNLIHSNLVCEYLLFIWMNLRNFRLKSTIQLGKSIAYKHYITNLCSWNWLDSQDFRENQIAISRFPKQYNMWMTYTGTQGCHGSFISIFGSYIKFWNINFMKFIFFQYSIQKYTVSVI